MYNISLLLVLLLTSSIQDFAIVDAITFPGLVYSQTHVMKRGIEELNCTEIFRLAFADNGTVCNDVESSLELIAQYFNDTVFVNVTDDTYRQLDSAVTEFCNSECKDLYVEFFECFNLTEFVSFYNYGFCGRMNQVYCMVHYLEGIATNTIQPITVLQNNCPNNSSSIDYCINGLCQDNITKFINYMSCCGAPLLVAFFDLNSCNVTNTDPCPSATLMTKTSLVIASSTTADYSQNNVRTPAITSVIPLTNTVPVVATPMCQGIEEAVTYLAVSIPVTMFFSSLLTAIITAVIVYAIMRRRSYSKTSPPTTTNNTQQTLIYDDVTVVDNPGKDRIELQANTAYGHIQY